MIVPNKMNTLEQSSNSHLQIKEIGTEYVYGALHESGLLSMSMVKLVLWLTEYVYGGIGAVAVSYSHIKHTGALHESGLLSMSMVNALLNVISCAEAPSG